MDGRVTSYCLTRVLPVASEVGPVSKKLGSYKTSVSILNVKLYFNKNFKKITLVEGQKMARRQAP